MNMNQFHLVNANKGYDTGDKLLQEVAKRVQGIIRQIDTVTRYAGDVFIFLLPQLSSPETAVYVAQRVLDNMALSFHVNNETIQINANIGVAVYPADGLDVKTLLKNANEALIQAKTQGPGKYRFYQQEMHALGERELELSGLFLRSNYLEKLSIQYFPQVNVKTQEIVSVQAVLFVTLPKFGPVAIAEFAKIAVNCKKLSEITDWLLENALKQFNQWHQQGFRPKKLVLTVSIDQIKEAQFIPLLLQKMKQYQMQSNQVVLEILGENIFLQTDLLANSFASLSSQGIQIAFSVFTLGALALQKLTQLPLNYLKIDSKLAQNDEVRRQNESIIHMLIAFSHEIQVDIVVDGINTEKQKEIFISLGCEIMQGKIFPMFMGYAPTKGAS